MFNLRKIEADEGSAFASMTFPRFRKLLGALQSYPQKHAIGAFKDDTPVGLVLFDSDPQAAAGEILSVFVRKEFRRQGIASSLLKAAEDHLTQDGATAVEMKFTEKNGTTHPMEDCSRRLGWPKPSLRMVLFKMTMDAVLSAHWVENFIRERQDLSVALWSSVTAQEHADLDRQGWIPDELSPSQHARQGVDGAAVVPELCLVCRKGSDIVGWHFSHRVNGDTVRFSVSYVHPDHQGDMVLPILWYHAAMQMKNTEYRNIRMGVAVHHDKMLSFCRKWLGPVAENVTQSMGIYKVLHSEREAVWI